MSSTIVDNRNGAEGLFDVSQLAIEVDKKIRANH